jgi:N-acetyl sugar amidotransferase
LAKTLCVAAPPRLRYKNRLKQHVQADMTFRHQDPRSRTLDYSQFAADNATPQAYYGLPVNIVFCRNCVISNQRPNSAVEYRHERSTKKATIFFDENGICDACRTAEQKAREVDWDRRRAELAALCDRYRSRNGSYDCLVPGSGGKDSFFQAWTLKNDFNMNPLTVTWAPNVYTEWGWRNFNRWIHAGFDNYLMTPNGRVKRLLTRLAVENLFHPFQPFMIGQKALAPKIAATMNIPLIFYGENEAEYGNPIADNESAKRDYAYFTSASLDDIYLSGTSVRELIDNYKVRRSDLQPYLPANPADLESRGIQVHYLGYYLKWHPQSAYYFAVEHGEFEASPERTPGTYSKYNSIDDRIDDLHYYTTYIKFGIGRATYDSAQEVRSGDLEREEAVALVKRFDGEYPERFSDELLQYLSLPAEQFPEAAKMFESPIMDRSYFDALADQFRSPHLWMYDGREWRLRRRVFDSN